MFPSKLDLDKFQKQKKSEWERSALIALKGRPLEDIQWAVDQHTVVDPYYDQTEIKECFEINRNHNDWWIGEYFDGSDPGEMHGILMNALSNGLNSPDLDTISNLDLALSDVRLDFIYPFFTKTETDTFLTWMESQPYDVSHLRGGFFAADEGYSTVLASEIKRIQSLLPQYYHTQIFACQASDPESADVDPKEDYGGALGRDMVQLQHTIASQQNDGIIPRIVLKLEIGSNFITHIARLRALRVLVDRLCMANKLNSDCVLIDSIIIENSMDLQLGMIGASTKATAAVTGGVDRMTITCEPMNISEDELTQRRMCRNIHHVLKLESGMHKVLDPAGGSYIIEKLTGAFVNRAWAVFQEES